MRKVIRIDEKEENKKPIELTHYWDGYTYVEWDGTRDYSIYNKIIYLGKDPNGKGLFACTNNNGVIMCKGHLNDGVY